MYHYHNRIIERRSDHWTFQKIQVFIKIQSKNKLRAHEIRSLTNLGAHEIRSLINLGAHEIRSLTNLGAHEIQSLTNLGAHESGYHTLISKGQQRLGFVSVKLQVSE